MNTDDVTYYYHRAEDELARAQTSDVPAAVKAHYMMAGYYLDRVYGDPKARSIIGASARPQPLARRDELP